MNTCNIQDSVVETRAYNIISFWTRLKEQLSQILCLAVKTATEN